MRIFEIAEYKTELKELLASVDLGFLRGKTLLISGASGLVMSYLIDALLCNKELNVRIHAITSSGGAKARFPSDPRLSFVVGDVRDAKTFEGCEGYDYVIHAASITDPKGYATKPIDTMLINIEGTKNLLDIAERCGARFLLISSCEVYGESDIEPIPENYCGKLDSMDVRSCYNESKRACETLCVSYAKQKGADVVVARLSRIFGPTMSLKDTKALSQFLLCAANHAAVVMKSNGKQRYSYTYVADAVSGILCLLKKGICCQAYNVCNSEALSLKEVAEIVAKEGGVDLRMDLSHDPLSQGGYTRTVNAIQSSSKLKTLGWATAYTLEQGIRSTLAVLRKLL